MTASMRSSCLNMDVDFQVREMFESSIAFGRAALEELGIEPDVAATTATDVRKRDTARLILQKGGDTMGGAELVAGAKIAPNRSWHPPPRRAASMPRRGTFSAKGRFDGSRQLRSRAAGRYGAAALRRRVDDAPRACHDRDRSRWTDRDLHRRSRVAALHFVAEDAEPDGRGRHRHRGDVSHRVDQCGTDDPDRRACVARAWRAGPTARFANLPRQAWS